MKELKLNNSIKVTLIDDADYDTFSKYKWYLRNGYAARYRSVKENAGTFEILLHRQLLAPSAGHEIDHIDGNALNNQRNNLRPCLHSENTRNVKKHKDNASGHKGVWKRKGRRKKAWVAQIMTNGKKTTIGSFYTVEEASAAYDLAAK